jgi:hypothetical protein
VDSIKIVQNYSLKFYKNGRRLTASQLLNAIKSNKEAYSLMKNAKDKRDIGVIMGSIGGFMVGYSLGASLGEGKLDKISLGLGGSLVLLSIPFSSGYTVKTFKAVKIYNNGLRTSQTIGSHIEIHSSPNGVGLIVVY